MTLPALALVLIAAVMHATWNLLAKRALGGTAFVWLFGALAVVIYAPFTLAVVLWQRPHIGGVQVLFVCGTGLLHMTYFLALQRGYRAGDLSVVYPLARGTGPLLSTAAAIALLAERPGPLALAGTLLIAGGAVFLTMGPRTARGSRARTAVLYGLFTGAIIAAYTLWDKQAVSVLMIPPLLQDWGGQLGQTALLTPYALRHWDTVHGIWRTNRREVLGVAVLAPLAYVLVLTALAFAPVSFVAPAREISILIGTAMGTRLLAEGHTARRLLASGAMLLGIVALVAG